MAETRTKTKFNSYYQKPELKTNPEWYKKTISGDRLGYDEHGQVVVKQLPEIELQKQIDSYYDEYCMTEQIRKAQMAIEAGESFEGKNYGDVSEIPAERIDQLQAYKANSAKLANLETELGSETSQAALKAKNEKEIEELVDKLLKEKIEKAAQKADESTEDK